MIDFLIITALEEERDSVLAKFDEYKKEETSSDNIRVYFRTSLKTDNKNLEMQYSIVITCLLGMGRVEATNATDQALRKWNPSYVILVGIAGGVKKNDVNLGDILISDQIVDYSLQKLRVNKTDYRFRAFPVDPRLLSWAQNLVDVSFDKLTVERPNNETPKRHIGPIASGDNVIAKISFMNDLLDKWNKLIGVEMESGGTVHSCYTFPSKPGFFMIRGVSDLADEDKDSAEVKKWRQYACEIAATYTYEFLKSAPIPVSSKKSETVNKKSFNELKDKLLKDRIKSLEEEYTAVSNQISNTLDEDLKIRLYRKLKNIEIEISKPNETPNM